MKNIHLRSKLKNPNIENPYSPSEKHLEAQLPDLFVKKSNDDPSGIMYLSGDEMKKMIDKDKRLKHILVKSKKTSDVSHLKDKLTKKRTLIPIKLPTDISYLRSLIKSPGGHMSLNSNYLKFSHKECLDTLFPNSSLSKLRTTESSRSLYNFTTTPELNINFFEKEYLGSPSGIQEIENLSLWFKDMKKSTQNDEDSEIIHMICAKELIRQVTVHCALRGKLLKEVFQFFPRIFEKKIAKNASEFEKAQKETEKKFKNSEKEFESRVQELEGIIQEISNKLEKSEEIKKILEERIEKNKKMMSDLQRMSLEGEHIWRKRAFECMHQLNRIKGILYVGPDKLAPFFASEKGKELGLHNDAKELLIKINSENPVNFIDADPDKIEFIKKFFVGNELENSRRELQDQEFVEDFKFYKSIETENECHEQQSSRIESYNENVFNINEKNSVKIESEMIREKNAINLKNNERIENKRKEDEETQFYNQNKSLQFESTEKNSKRESENTSNINLKESYSEKHVKKVDNFQINPKEIPKGGKKETLEDNLYHPDNSEQDLIHFPGPSLKPEISEKRPRSSKGFNYKITSEELLPNPAEKPAITIVNNESITDYIKISDENDVNNFSSCEENEKFDYILEENKSNASSYSMFQKKQSVENLDINEVPSYEEESREISEILNENDSFHKKKPLKPKRISKCSQTDEKLYSDPISNIDAAINNFNNFSEQEFTVFFKNLHDIFPQKHLTHPKLEKDPKKGSKNQKFKRSQTEIKDAIDQKVKPEDENQNFIEKKHQIIEEIKSLVQTSKFIGYMCENKKKTIQALEEKIQTQHSILKFLSQKKIGLESSIENQISPNLSPDKIDNFEVIEESPIIKRLNKNLTLPSNKITDNGSFTEGYDLGFEDGKLQGYNMFLESLNKNNVNSKEDSGNESLEKLENLENSQKKRTSKASTKFAEFNFHVPTKALEKKKTSVGQSLLEKFLKKSKEHIISKSALSRKKVNKLFANIYHQGALKVNNDNLVNLIEVTYEEFGSQYALKSALDKKFIEFIASVVANSEFKRCSMYLRLIGYGDIILCNNYSKASVNLYLTCYQYLTTSKLGIFFSNDDDDKIMIPTLRVNECIKEKIEYLSDKGTQMELINKIEHKSIPDPKKINAGGVVEMEAVLEMILDNYEIFLEKRSKDINNLI